jgi:hypothetical protein
MTKYNTNLAAEFHVLSVLHRLGAEATLTLGNKKSVDLVVVRSTRDVVTVDVKGLAGKTGWPIDNVQPKLNHFLVFVSFLDNIADPKTLPEVYVVPSANVPGLTYYAKGGRKLMQLRDLRERGQHYMNAWEQLL